MNEVVRVGEDADHRLEALGLSASGLDEVLRTAASDALLCTGLDAPGLAGVLFWSRANRYLREWLQRQGWKYSNKDQVLRTFPAMRDFAITAMSGKGGVGNKDKRASTKNPKGPAVARLVESNGQLVIPELISMASAESEIAALPGIPTWFLLYKRTDAGISAELSLPVEMHGYRVDTWSERIMLASIPFDGPDLDLDLPMPDDGPDVAVSFRG
jgi:hypothetical protein